MRRAFAPILVLSLAGCSSVSTVTPPPDTADLYQGLHLTVITHTSRLPHITTAGEVTMTDARTRTVIAQKRCYYSSADDKSPPSYDDIVGNDAAVLKDKLENSTYACAQVFANTLLSF